ncbi:MAG: 6,7-dimethyl-8-ribityllumazine synthase [Candidatus Moraniibacteriota bacterium]
MQRKRSVSRTNRRDASRLRVGIVVSPYYEAIAKKLLRGALAELGEWRVEKKNIFVMQVSGSFEIPYGCVSLMKQHRPDAIVTLGCVVKGETNHDQIIAQAVAQGLIDLTIKYEIPITLGVLTVNTLEQAIARSTPGNNKGREATAAALEAALL